MVENQQHDDLEPSKEEVLALMVFVLKESDAPKKVQEAMYKLMMSKRTLGDHLGDLAKTLLGDRLDWIKP